MTIETFDINDLGDTKLDDVDPTLRIDDVDIPIDEFGNPLIQPDAVVSEFQIYAPGISLNEFRQDVNRKSPVTFGNFQKFIPGDFNYQNSLLRIGVRTKESSATVPVITQLIHHTDVPDIVTKGTFEFTTAQSETINFAAGTNYTVLPTVSANVISGTGSPYVEITNVTTTSFTASIIRRSDGSLDTGTINFIAVGY